MKDFNTKNLSELWTSFVQMQKVSEQYAKDHNIYDPKQRQPVPEKAVNNYFELELTKNDLYGK